MTNRRKRRNDIFHTPIDEDVSLTKKKRDIKNKEENEYEEEYEEEGHRKKYRPVPDRKVLLRRQEKGKKRRRYKFIFNTVKLFLIVIVIFLIARSPLFGVKRMEVTGSKAVSASQVITASGIRVGDNAFAVSGGSLLDHILLRFTGNKKDILDKLPLLKSVDIDYRMFGGITITVQESREFGQIRMINGEIAVVDDRLMVIEVKKQYVPKLLKVKGTENETLAVGGQFSGSSGENWVWAANLIRLIGDYDVPKRYKESLSEIDVSHEEALIFKVGSINIKIGDFETMTQSKLLDILKRTDTYISQLSPGEKGTIDFTLTENAVLTK